MSGKHIKPYQSGGSHARSFILDGVLSDIGESKMWRPTRGVTGTRFSGTRSPDQPKTRTRTRKPDSKTGLKPVRVPGFKKVRERFCRYRRSHQAQAHALRREKKSKIAPGYPSFASLWWLAYIKNRHSWIQPQLDPASRSAPYKSKRPQVYDPHIQREVRWSQL